MNATHEPIQVYVGTYAKYNSGSIEGAWLDCEDYSSKMDTFFIHTDFMPGNSRPVMQPKPVPSRENAEDRKTQRG